MYSHSHLGDGSGRAKGRVHLTSAVQKLELSYFSEIDTDVFKWQFILMIGRICTVEFPSGAAFHSLSIENQAKSVHSDQTSHFQAHKIGSINPTITASSSIL